MKLTYLFDLRAYESSDEIDTLINGLVEFASFVESHANQAFDNDDLARAIYLTTNLQAISRQKATINITRTDWNSGKLSGIMDKLSLNSARN